MTVPALEDRLAKMDGQIKATDLLSGGQTHVQRGGDRLAKT